jgi:Holliday junction resolvase-like predicted endonuclease
MGSCKSNLSAPDRWANPGGVLTSVPSLATVLSFVLALALSAPFAQARGPQESRPSPALEADYAALKDSGAYLGITGTICEEVARLDVADEYKEPEYSVVTGIAYGNSRKVIGELDVIVFENRTGDVVKIAEVKCWKDLEGGLQKAMDQRQRFLKNVQKGGLYFQSTHDKRQYSQKHFRKVKDFETIGQQGAKDYGYTRELEHSLEDLMALRKRIMDCQATAECKRP